MNQKQFPKVPHARHLALDANGSRVAVSYDTGVEVLYVASGEVRKEFWMDIKDGCKYVAWNPNGLNLGCVRDNGNILDLKWG